MWLGATVFTSTVTEVGAWGEGTETLILAGVSPS